MFIYMQNLPSPYSPVAYVTICTGCREITVQIDFFFDFGWSGSILLKNHGVKTLRSTELSLGSKKIFLHIFF